MDPREYFRQFADDEEFERIVEKPTVTAMWRDCTAEFADRDAIVFKGESFDGLSQEQVDLMMSHINSYARASLMKGDAPCRTPYERFVFEFGEEVADKLGIVRIPLKDVTLRPELLDMR